MDIERIKDEIAYYFEQAKTEEEIYKWADALAHLEMEV